MPENVLLIHGISSFSMLLSPYAIYLRRHSYRTKCWGYRSLGHSVTDHATRLREVLQPYAEAEETTHFVTHSMGGIVLRAALDGITWRNAGRLVMLAPPNHGARVASVFAKAFAWACPALNDISDTADSLVQRLPEPIQLETGVIAGSRDMLVALDSTRLVHLRDHIVVTSGHNRLLFHTEAMRETLHFLRHGQFSPEAKRVASWDAA